MIALGELDTVIAIGIFLAAILYSSAGHGGASGYLAVMALAGLPVEEMRPTALGLNLLVASLAWSRFYKSGAFSWDLLLPFAIASVPTAFLGGTIGLESKTAFLLIGTALLVAAANLMRPWSGLPKGASPPPTALALATGAGLGFLSGAVGVGGGIFLSPLLLLCKWGLPATVAGVAAAFVFLNSAAGLAGYFAAGYRIPGPFLLWGCAAIFGGMLGSHWGSADKTGRRIRRLLALILVIAAIKLLVA